MMNDLPISPYKNFKYSISSEAWDEESLEIGQTDNRGVVVETTINTIGDILYEAGTTYGIYMPFAFGRWESTYPDEDTDYFEKGIRKFYTLHITNEDGTEITDEESDFITFLLSDGRYQLNKFRDYAVGGIVLGSIALGVGALITYFYFKDEKSTENKVEELAENKVEELAENKIEELAENKVEELTENEDVKSSNSRAKSVTHTINGKNRKFPIKDAWKREHKIENKSERFEVPQANRKPLTYADGGDISSYYDDIEFGTGGVAKTKEIITQKIGLSEEIADFLISKSEKFAIWLADSIVKAKMNILKENTNNPVIKKQVVDEINQNPNSVKGLSQRITGVLDWLKSPNLPQQNLRELSFEQAEQKSKRWHDELSVSGGDVDFVEPEENLVLKTYPTNEFGKTYYWVLLPSNICRLESSRMGHCGESGKADNLISLRSNYVNKNGENINDSHITIAYGDGYFYQVKGKQNKKPLEKYFPYLFDFIKSLIKGEISNMSNTELVNKRNELVEKYENENIGTRIEKKQLENEINEIDVQLYNLTFNGFSSEYASKEDYGWEDMTKQELTELYELNPDIFNDFAGQYMLYEAGITRDRPDTTIVIEKSPEYIVDLLSLDTDLSDEFVEKVITGDTYEWFDGSGTWSYYFENAGDYVDNLNELNYDNVIDKIVEITGLEKSVVVENGAKHYLDGDDDDFPSDDFDDIKRSIAGAYAQAEESAYSNYYYNNITDALSELGTIIEIDDRGVKLEIDLLDKMSIGGISGYMQDLETENLEDVFFEAESQGEIELPSLSIDDRWTPYVTDEDFNDNFEIDNYSKGGTLRPKNINTNKKTKIKNMKPNQKKYAQGGLTEHGLKVGDKIIFDHISDENIDIKDSDGNKHIVDLDRGIRYANGGEVGEEEIDDFVYEYGVSRKEAEETLKRRKGRLSAKENLRLKELSRKNKNVGLTLTDSEEIEFDKLVHKYRGWDYKMANGGEAGNKTIKNIRKKRPKTRQPKIVRQYFEDEAFEYASGGRITSNDGIIEAFLTSERQLKVGNLSTHFNEYDNQILLRNYGTLIATRKGNNVEITNVKYSQTTSRITNKVNSMAMQKGMNVSYVSKFADGGDVVKEPTQSELNKMTAFDLMDAMKNDKKNYEIYKKQLLTLYPDAKGFADGGEAGQYVLENRGRLGYAVLNTKTNMYVDIDFQSKEDAENFIIEKNREKRLFGFEPRLNIGSEGFADGGEAGGKSTKRPIRKKTQPKIVRQYFEDEAFEYAGGGETYSLSDFPIYANEDGEVRFVRNPKKDVGKGEDKEYAISVMIDGKVDKYADEYFFDTEKKANLWVGKLNKFQEQTMTNENKQLVKDWFAENDDRISELIYNELRDLESQDFKYYVKNQVNKKFAEGGEAGEKFAKGGMFGGSAKLEYIGDAYASDEMADELRKKLKIKGDSLANKDVISFAYTDYGGDFLDKVAIAYFSETYPKNTIAENSGFGGKNAFVFGEPAKQWIEQTEDYPLGFEDFEDFYMQQENEQEGEDFNYFLDEISKEYTFDKETVLNWLGENKGGYYGMTTQGLDFSYEDLTEELVNEGLIEKIEEDDEYAKGGVTKRRTKVKELSGGRRRSRKPKEKVLNVRARGGFTLDDFNPLLDYYDQVVSYKKVGKLELHQIVGKNDVEDTFDFNTEKDRDYWYEILTQEQEKFFTIKNKKKYVDYILERHDPYSEKAEEEGITKKSEMLDYFGDEISYELRNTTEREEFIRSLDLKNKFEDGGDVEEKFRYKDFYQSQGGIKFKTEEEAERFIKTTKPFVRKQLREGNFVLVFNGKEYFIGEKIKINDEYAEGGGVNGISHYKVGDAIFIDYMDAVSYCDRNNLSYDEIVKTNEYAEGGEIQDWMEEALESLIEETGNETLDITMVSNSGTEFFASNQNEEYRVFKSEDDAELTAEDEVREDMEDMPENFNQDFIINYIDGGDYFEQSLMEMNTSYADDIENESDSRYGSRLIAEMINYGLMDEDEAESENAEELAEEYKYDFVSLLTEEQMNQGNNGFDYFVSNFGEEETMKMVIKNNLIDIYRASKDAVQIDGVGHFLSRYDGETLYLSNGYVAFRNN